MVPAREFVKATHIMTVYDKASQVQNVLNSVFRSKLRQNLPLGKKLRFVPYALDTRFIISNKQRFNIKKSKAAKKSFIDSVETLTSHSIIGLDYHHPIYNVTLRESIMAL